MKPTNSKEVRSKILHTLPPEKFDTYFDYYVYIHLNRNVQVMHVIGMLLGFLFLTLAIMKWSWIYLGLHLFCFNIIPLVSHNIFDGVGTPTATGAPLISIWYAMKINMWYLTGQQDIKEREFLARYPFAEHYYKSA